MCLRVGHQHSQFRPNQTCFVDYYSPFWGLEAVSIVVEPQDVLTCWSSTITVWAGFGPFHGLLLTAVGSQSDFHGCRMSRCAYVLVAKIRCLGRFWPVCWTITQFWGPEVISTIDEARGAFTRHHQHSQFWPILVRFVDYYSPFWGPSAISTIDDPWVCLHVCHQQS